MGVAELLLTSIAFCIKIIKAYRKMRKEVLYHAGNGFVGEKP